MTDEWQSMESAPRDGTSILLYVPSLARSCDRAAIIECEYTDGTWWPIAWTTGCDFLNWKDDGEYAPIAWKPILNRPK